MCKCKGCDHYDAWNDECLKIKPRQFMRGTHAKCQVCPFDLEACQLCPYSVPYVAVAMEEKNAVKVQAD